MHHKSQNIANKLNSSYHQNNNNNNTNHKLQCTNYNEKSAGITSFSGPHDSRIFIKG